MSTTSVTDSNGQAPRALAISIDSGFIETAISPAMTLLAGVVGTMAANISTIAPIHEISGAITTLLGRHRHPVKHEAEIDRREDHVDEAEIENSSRVFPRPAGVEKEQQGRDHAGNGDPVGDAEDLPLWVTVAHRADGEMAKDDADRPQAGGDQAHHSQPARGVLEEVARKRAQAAALGDALEVGRATGPTSLRCPMGVSRRAAGRRTKNTVRIADIPAPPISRSQRPLSTT